jgi:hypothetical protein
MGYVGGSGVETDEKWNAGGEEEWNPLGKTKNNNNAPGRIEFKFKRKYPSDIARFQRYLDVKPMEEQFYGMYHRYSDMSRFNKFFLETSI